MTRPYNRTFGRGERKSVLDNYLNLRHQHKFLWRMIERVNADEDLTVVMKDYGYLPDPSCGQTQYEGKGVSERTSGERG